MSKYISIFLLNIIIAGYVGNGYGKQKVVVLSNQQPTQIQVQNRYTRYIVKRCINLNGDTLRIPDGSALVFHGSGKLVNGTIIGQSTRIIATRRLIFENIVISQEGTWKNDYAYPEWFGACNKPSFDSKLAIQKAIDVADTCILSQAYYTNYDTPTRRGDDVKFCAMAIKNKCLRGLRGNKLFIDAKNSSTERSSVLWIGDNVMIDGINIEYLNVDFSSWTGIQAGVYRVQGGNVKIENTTLRGAMAAWINLIGQAGRENFTIRNNFVHDCDCGLIIQGDNHTPGEIYPIKLLMENNVIEKEKERHSEFVSFWGACNEEGMVYYTDVLIRNNKFYGGYYGGCITGHPKYNGLKNVIIEGNEFYDCGACSFYNADGLVYKYNYVTGSTFVERQVKGVMGSFPDLAFYNCSNCTIDDCSCFGLKIKDCQNFHIGKLKQTLCLQVNDPYLKQKDFVTNFIGIDAENSTVTIDDLTVNPFASEDVLSNLCRYYVHKGSNSVVVVNKFKSTIPIQDSNKILQIKSFIGN